MSQRRDSRRNAERIVQALRDLWTDEGSPSMQQVAQRAGVGIATLYRHFPNRGSLEKAAFQSLFAEEIAPIVDRAAAADELDLLTVAEEFVTAIGRYAPLLSVIEVSVVTDEALDTLAESFLGLLHDGQDSGVLRADLEPVNLFWVLRMLVLGLTSELSSPSVRRRYLALVMPSVMPGGPPIPALAAEDYDRMGVAPEHRGPRR
ncbi:hypothetical protein BHE97_03000 [Aeromicrobium sp. PE09-221]|uniref:TetR/AcrR family transcriptional regulator n=1 Tax=Aeromicrobium sp. PE09-221 TaxID=1898043 RepID=UPI000B3E4185|nr:TetR/AcrR family transcriptional regulator [Aeromicrobium sp. PE09-221]OUZ12172.1 hypothetical protein BHE97_03000 [Aeromicrobium sp. PE09-221]